MTMAFLFLHNGTKGKMFDLLIKELFYWRTINIHLHFKILSGFILRELIGKLIH